MKYNFYAKCDTFFMTGWLQNLKKLNSVSSLLVEYYTLLSLEQGEK